MAGVKRSAPANASRGVVYEMTRTGTGAAIPTTARAQSDTSGITEAARSLSAALQVVAETDDIRAERVEALRKQIAEGKYNPDPREIAVRLVERGF